MKYKIRAVLLSICFVVSMFGMTAMAASGSMSMSGATGNVGSTVTVNYSVRCQNGPIGSATVVITYNAAALEYVSGTNANGGGGSVRAVLFTSSGSETTLRGSIQFKIKAEGSHGLSGSVTEAYDFAETPMTVGGASAIITGKAQTTSPKPPTNNRPSGNNSTTNNNTSANNNPADGKDSNSKLNSLQVSPGTLAPVFNADTTSYTVAVPKDTTEVTIAATAQSDKATVSVTGGKDLKPGENEAKVVVMAESGATTVYTLTILCGEEARIQVDGREHTINETFTDEQIPTGFVRQKITYDDRQYEALKHERGELYLVNLQNSETGATFYIYDQKTQEFYHYAQISFQDNRYIIILPLDQTKEFAKCEMTTLTLQGKQFDAWKLDDEYSVIRVMNHDGEITFYQYDSLDGTLQRYTKPVAQKVEEEEKKFTFLSLLEKYHLYVIAGLGALVLILAMILIYLLATKNHRHQARRQRLQKRMEKRREE